MLPGSAHSPGASSVASIWPLPLPRGRGARQERRRWHHPNAGGGGGGRTQRSPTGEAPAWGGGCVGGGWWARSKDQEQPHPGQEASSETLHPSPAEGKGGSRCASVGDWQGHGPKQLDGWHAADAPSHPNEAQMPSSSTRRKEAWGRVHLCLQSGLAQPSAPASQPGSEWVSGRGQGGSPKIWEGILESSWWRDPRGPGNSSPRKRKLQAF